MTEPETAEARRTTVLQPVEGKPHHRKTDKIKRQRTLYQMKEQDKTPEKQLNEVEKGNRPEKEFSIVTLKMVQNLGKRLEAKTEKMQEVFNKDLEELKNKHLEELKNKQTEMNSTITEMKNTLEGFNNRIKIGRASCRERV